MDKRDKSAGIVCDDYKVKAYEKELKSQGFEYTLHPFKDDRKLTNIKVVCSKHEYQKINDICTQLETFFKSRRN